MHIVVGLGNPGDAYENTRHNVGREIVTRYAEDYFSAEWEKSSAAHAHFARVSLKESPLLLVLPETFMNRSGDAVAYLAKQHSVPPDNVVVVYDDLDLPVGTFKISHDRGSGGHNGVQSVVDRIGSKKCVRVRVGIAPRTFFGGVRRPTGAEVSSFVLKRFSKREAKAVTELQPKIEEAIACIVEKGVSVAMTEYNGR